MVALATLMYEILLTRIFSVTMWYHFAFMAISMAMFGMTVGAILVYLYPVHFIPEKVPKQLVISTLLFSVAIVLSFVIHLFLPFIAPGNWVNGLLHIVGTFVVIAVPFVFSGIAVCLCLTKFTTNVSLLYAADLAGAAAGCMLLLPLLNLCDGPSAVFFVAALAGLAAVCFAFGLRSKPAEQQTVLTKTLLASSVAFTALLATFAATNAVMANQQQPLVRLRWVHGYLEQPPLYEKWNSFSRVIVTGEPETTHRPFAWGLSSTWPETKNVSELTLTIDAGAGTVLTKFDGNLDKVEHLKYDLTNLVHYIRPDARVLIVGVGGGRDVLSALVFKQKYIEGVEINNNIIDSLARVFGDYTGHLTQYPQVKIVNDEARSYIARSQKKFDIIQISLIDTFAATAAGAFVLTEHSLYTTQAWRSFLDHLSPHGVLSVSRWYFKERPGEMYRLVALASTALKEIGVQDPRKNIVVVAALGGGNGGRASDGIGTVLVSRDPFTPADIERIQTFAREKKFEMTLTPDQAEDANFATIANGKDMEQLFAAFPVNISPPTDDSPYFFHMLRLKDVFNPSLWAQGVMSANSMAINILGWLLITVSILTLLCILIPLMLTIRTAPLAGAMPLLLYFASIGLAFMFIEISQMQRLIVFLGHPVYGLSVVLFTLLLASGLGSFTTNNLAGKIDMRKLTSDSALTRFVGLLSMLIVFGLATPLAVESFASAETWLRVLVAVVILFPLGLFMGMAFPIGMIAAGKNREALTPWLWGVNGATSVCASVLAVAIALSFGISATFWTGFVCYALAFLFLLWSQKLADG
jgi:predicted membrane-bound spermidine synthase